jgi:hypothetical protein
VVVLVELGPQIQDLEQQKVEQDHNQHQAQSAPMLVEVMVQILLA